MMGAYYPKRFPSFWETIDQLVVDSVLMSVREVRKELENRCRFVHIEEWVHKHPEIFPLPTANECKIVADLFKKEQYRGFVKRDNLLKGTPVADPFIIASAKISNRCVVTQESDKVGGARIPTACKELGIECIDLEGFLEQQKIKL